MEQLQAKGELQSWQIFQEKTGSVCVKLRFECNGDKKSDVDISEPVSYKRKSKKQMDRDAKRASKFHRDDIITRSKSEFSNQDKVVELPRGQSENLCSETHDLHISQVGSMLSPVQVEQSPVKHDSPLLSYISDPESPGIDVNKPSVVNNYAYAGNESATVIVENCSANNESTNSKSWDTEPRCSVCGTMPGMCWRTCTHDDHKDVYCICNACFHSGHKHDYHKDLLKFQMT